MAQRLARDALPSRSGDRCACGARPAFAQQGWADDGRRRWPMPAAANRARPPPGCAPAGDATAFIASPPRFAAHAAEAGNRRRRDDVPPRPKPAETAARLHGPARRASTASTSPTRRPTRGSPGRRRRLPTLEQEIDEAHRAAGGRRPPNTRSGWRAGTSSPRRRTRTWCASMRACVPMPPPCSCRPWTRKPPRPCCSSSSRAPPA